MTVKCLGNGKYQFARSGAKSRPSRQSRSKALFADGRNLYAEYLRSGGSATLKPRADIIRTMARRLDLTQTYIQEALSAYLWDL